jgi:hypothetical protein
MPAATPAALNPGQGMIAMQRLPFFRLQPAQRLKPF